MCVCIYIYIYIDIYICVCVYEIPAMPHYALFYYRYAVHYKIDMFLCGYVYT